MRGRLDDQVPRGVDGRLARSSLDTSRSATCDSCNTCARWLLRTIVTAWGRRPYEPSAPQATYMSLTKDALTRSHPLLRKVPQGSSSSNFLVAKRSTVEYVHCSMHQLLLDVPVWSASFRQICIDVAKNCPFTTKTGHSKHLMPTPMVE